jgi:hypothetical protein
MQKMLYFTYFYWFLFLLFAIRKLCNLWIVCGLFKTDCDFVVDGSDLQCPKLFGGYFPTDIGERG